MRNTLLGGATALAMTTGAAMAGGYSSGAMPGPAAAFEGFTIGLGVGYSETETEARAKGVLAGTGAGGDYDDANARLSAELRYLHAVNSWARLGLGIEAFYDAAEASGSCAGSVPVAVSCTSSDSWGGDLFAVAGATVSDDWLVYGRGGATLANSKDSATVAIGPGVTLSESGWNDGLFLGAGLETHIADNLTLGIEGDYRWMSERDVEVPLFGTVASFESERWNIGLKLRSGF